MGQTLCLVTVLTSGDELPRREVEKFQDDDEWVVQTDALLYCLLCHITRMTMMMIMTTKMITMTMTMIMQDGGGVLVKAVDGPCLSPAYNKPHLDHHYHHHSVQ